MSAVRSRPRPLLFEQAKQVLDLEAIRVGIPQMENGESQPLDDALDQVRTTFGFFRPSSYVQATLRRALEKVEKERMTQRLCSRWPASCGVGLRFSFR